MWLEKRSEREELAKETERSFQRGRRRVISRRPGERGPGQRHDRYVQLGASVRDEEQPWGMLVTVTRSISRGMMKPKPDQTGFKREKMGEQPDGSSWKFGCQEQGKG